jgi:uncharacterized SAM-binding protein YcdF (DUF218 family)
MIGKSYIFETTSTRLKRYFLNIALIALLSFILYSIFCVIFILVSEQENINSREALFNRPPDVIVVFTGDQGRIPYALKKARELKQSQIFITGVHSKNSVQTILDPMNLSEDFDANFLEIDYLARNTVENVISTLRYLRENKSLKNVLIISHDYHIMRIKIITNKIKTQSDQVEFYYEGVPTSYANTRNLKILYKEVYKLFRTYLFLMLWEVDSSLPI